MIVAVKMCESDFGATFVRALFYDYSRTASRIIHLNVGAPGARSDGGVWREDNMGKAIEDIAGCEVFLKAVETLKATKRLRVIENDHEGQETTSVL